VLGQTDMLLGLGTRIGSGFIYIELH